MVLKRIWAAFRGRSFWLKLDRKYRIDDNSLYVLLMLEDDQELNDLALRHIDDMLTFRKGRGVVILTDQVWVLTNSSRYSNAIVDNLHISDREINNLLSLYELYEFSGRFIVVSLYKPYGRQVYKAVGIHGITKEDIICNCLYQIHSWWRWKNDHDH